MEKGRERENQADMKYLAQKTSSRNLTVFNVSFFSVEGKKLFLLVQVKKRSAALSGIDDLNK